MSPMTIAAVEVGVKPSDVIGTKILGQVEEGVPI